MKRALNINSAAEDLQSNQNMRSSIVFLKFKRWLNKTVNFAESKKKLIFNMYFIIGSINFLLGQVCLKHG